MSQEQAAINFDPNAVLQAFNPEGRKMEFSNNGKAWFERELIGVNLDSESPFRTKPTNEGKLRSNWRMMREVPPVRKMTIEEAEKAFGIKIE